MSPAVLDFKAPGFFADPYPLYRRLRTEDPVHESAAGDWYLSRFADVDMLLNDPCFGWQPQGGVNPFTGRQRESTPIDAMLTNWMIFMDPPGHTRLRSVFSEFFSQNLIDSMTASIQHTVDGLLEAVLDSGSMDVIADLAYPLPVMVISGMLGVPVEDHALFKQPSMDLAKAIDSNSDEELFAANPAVEMLMGYFRDLVAERRKRPKADMISSLIAVQERDRGLSEEELLISCIFLLWAGHETTKNLIGNAILILLRNPDQMDILSRDPRRVRKALEEILRFESPVQRIGRWTVADISIGGRIIPKGRFVTGLTGAAHRDPDRFEDPDRFDIGRSVGRHFAFGWGVHHCLGNVLARIEAQIAINTVLRRMRYIELQTEKPEWQEITFLRGLKTLPVSFQPA